MFDLFDRLFGKRLAYPNDGYHRGKAFFGGYRPPNRKRTRAQRIEKQRRKHARHMKVLRNQ